MGKKRRGSDYSLMEQIWGKIDLITDEYVGKKLT